MRIAFLTQYYPPELGASQQRLSHLARNFVMRGHEVHVLTAMPNYPMGKIFDGYRSFIRRESLDGVNVLRAPIYATQSAAMLRRLTNYFSFVGSSAIVGTARLPKLDFLLVESPPLFLGMSGILLAAKKHARLIFNVSDLYPATAARLGVVREGGIPWRIAAALEAACYRAAWLVTGQSRTITEDISARFPFVRTWHLSNGCDTGEYGPQAATAAARRRIDPEGNRRVLVYAGLHGLAQGLDQLLTAADRLRHEHDLRFVLIGDGPEKQHLVREAAARGLKNVRFLDPVPSTEVPALLASADGILVTLKTDIPGAVPSKIYEAMASERPVILVARGEAADIVRSAGGYTVDPGDAEGLVTAIRSLVNEAADARRRAQRAREETVAHFDRFAIATRFIDLLEAESHR